MKTEKCRNRSGGRKAILNKTLWTVRAMCLSIMLLFMLTGMSASAQSSCTSAVLLPGTDTCISINSGTEYWLQFEGQLPHVKAQVYSTSGSVIENITLYSGDCGNLQYVADINPSQPLDTAILTYYHVGKTTQYFLKLEFSQVGTYNLCLYNGPKLPLPCVSFSSIYGPDYCCPGTSPACTLSMVCANDEACLSSSSVFWTALTDSVENDHEFCLQFDFYGYIPNPPCDSTNTPQCVSFPTAGFYPVTMSSYIDGEEYFETPVFYIEVLPAADASFTVDPTGPICPEDCISLTINDYQYSSSYLVDWGDGSNWGSINYPYTHCYDYSGSYTITVYAENACGSDTSTYVMVVGLLASIDGPDSVCVGSSAIFVGSTLCQGTNIVSWLWDMGDGATYSTQSVTHTYSQTGTYNIQLTITDDLGNIGVAYHQIVVVALPPLPEITGNRNNCDTIATYTIANPQPNCVYLWGLNNSAAYSSDVWPMPGNQITVNWYPNWLAQDHDYTTMVVVCYNTITHCSSLDSIRIWKCCKGKNQTFLNDTTITDAGIFSLASEPILNGDIIINNTFSVPSGQTIWMGPEARIIVNPPYTFTVNARTIAAGCKYMWDGIYVTDSNAKVEIVNISTIQDAYNAIVSENGGKYNLVYSNFYNNNISVLVKKYFRLPGIPALTRHKGFISRCRFAKNGAGMIAPYLNIKPTFGVFSDNVYLLTIGDSMQSINKNSFQDIYCGIASFNSSLNVYNNEFINIKPASACATIPGEYVQIQCETAVHSVSTEYDPWHLNASALNIGGPSTIGSSGNTFNNVQTGIYTYKTTSKIRYNNISNSASWAISLRDFGSGSYVKNNTTQTNTANGIKILNTVPNGAAGIKLDVNNNTIVDPTNGIYISNVVSSPSNANFQAKVINNMIWMNGTTTSPHYGCRFENSDYIEAYCNKVKRSSLTPVVDSLKVIGFRFENCLGGYIHDNQFSKLSLGIKTSGIIGSPAYANANFKVNNLDSCYHAFYFETAYGGNSTYLVNQGTATSPSGNKFSDYPGRLERFRFWGALPNGLLINWFIQSGFQYLVSIPYGHPLVAKIVPMPATGVPSTIRCSSVQSSMSMDNGLVIEQGNSEAQSLDVALGDAYSFGEIDAEMKYNLQDYAYSVLSNIEQQPYSPNSNLLQQYSSDFSSLQEGNIGKFHQVLAHIDSGAFEEALSLNTTISPANQIEINRQYALNAYLEYVVPQAELPQSVVDVLQQIANTPTCIGGEGVYIARAIVGYEEPVIADQKSIQNVVNENQTILVFPNPTESEVNVLFDGFIAGQSIDFTVYNLMGNLVLSKKIVTGESLVIVDVSSLSSGYYVLMLKSTGQTIYNDRIVIIK